MRWIAAALLSLVSLLGGHCLNRRWDRVVVFATVAVVGAIAAWASLTWGWAEEVPSATVAADIRRMYSISIGAFAVLLIASAIVSALDARHESAQEGRIAPMLAGIVASITAIPFVFSAFAAVVVQLGATVGTDDGFTSDVSMNTRNYNFMHYIWLGETGDGELEEPPSGPAQIRGQMLYRGAPQSGVTLRLVLDGRYETPIMETDEEGIFRVSVPPGEWRIDQILTHGWAGKPETGRYTVVSGHEPPFELPYRRMVRHGDKPTTVNATAEDSEPQITLTIQRAIELEWPPDGAEPADASRDAISWRDSSDAAAYAVSIRRVEQDGDTTHYLSRTSARTDGERRLPLSDLPVIEAEGESGQYMVEVHAFDSSGRLLNHTPDYRAENHLFTMTDRMIAANDDWLQSESSDTGAGESVTAAQWEARAKADRRLDTSRHLIEEALYTPAETLLDRIAAEHAPPGRLSLMRGFLAASQGQCARAEEHFATARSEDPGVCISDCLRAGCPAPD